MELRPGYTMTELGVLPEDWYISTITSFTECTAGGTPSTKNPSYWGGKHPWMNSGELHLKRIYNVSGRITDNGIANSSTKYIPKESVLIGLAGQGKTRGTVAIAKIALCTNQSIAAIFPSKSCFSDYLFYNLDSRYTELRELSSGDGGRGGLNLKLIGNLLVPIPPLPEQHAIAAALSDVDALLDAQERLIAKKRNIKLAAMQQLLTGKTRLPGFQQNGKYKQTELGILPEDWEVKMLGEGLSSKPAYGINAPACSYQKNFSAYIRITDITDDGKYIPAAYVQVKSNDFYLQDGDIVLARTGASVGKSYLYKSSDGQLVFAGFLIRIHPDGETFFPSYIFYYLHTSNYWKWVASTSMRSGQPGVNGQEYARLLLPCPPLPEQRAIAAVLSDMDAELAALEARRDKLRAVKQGMMRELLTGRTRLAGAGGRHGQ